LPAARGFAEPSALTLEMAVQQALERSPGHRAAESAIQASRESALQAGQLPDPMLKLGIDNLPVEGPDRWSLTRDFMTMRRIGIEQQWVSSTKRAARTERADQMVAMQEAEALMHAAEIREQTAKAWIQMRHAQRSLGYAMQLAQHTADDFAAIQATHRGGKGSAADVVQAQLALTRAQDGVTRAKQDLAAARIALQRWVQAKVDTVDDHLPPLSVPAPHLESDSLEQYHPSLIKARRAQSLAEAEVTVAATERRPDWSFELAFSQRGSPYANMVSFGVTIPLTVNATQRQDRAVAEKAAQATAAKLQADEAQRTLAADLESLQATMTSLTERAAWLTQHALPAARQAIDLSVAAYRAGSGSLSSIFTARRTLVEQQLQIAELERDAALAWAQLAFPLNTVHVPIKESTP
ncbi:MAG: TolC family protein, partial [Betaproteobacteria bacterium]|nr:TolC family protein [Betaproteobacteria bacterium]